MAIQNAIETLRQLVSGLGIQPPAPVLPASIANPLPPPPPRALSIAPGGTVTSGGRGEASTAPAAPSIAPEVATGNPKLDKALTYGGDVAAGVVGSDRTAPPLSAFAQGFLNSRRSRIERARTAQEDARAAEDRAYERQQAQREWDYRMEDRSYGRGRDALADERQARLDALAARDTESQIAARGANGGLTASQLIDVEALRARYLADVEGFGTANAPFSEEDRQAALARADAYRDSIIEMLRGGATYDDIANQLPGSGTVPTPPAGPQAPSIAPTPPPLPGQTPPPMSVSAPPPAAAAASTAPRLPWQNYPQGPSIAPQAATPPPGGASIAPQAAAPSAGALPGIPPGSYTGTGASDRDPITPAPGVTGQALIDIYNAAPSGTYFINPADGSVVVKP